MPDISYHPLIGVAVLSLVLTTIANISNLFMNWQYLCYFFIFLKFRRTVLTLIISVGMNIYYSYLRIFIYYLYFLQTELVYFLLTETFTSCYLFCSKGSHFVAILKPQV